MIKAQLLFELLDLDSFLSLGALIALAWIFYKAFLRGVSQERHDSLNNHYRNLTRQFLLFSCWFGLFLFLKEFSASQSWAAKSLLWVACIALVWGSIVFIRASRLILLQYLFLGSMQAGVPLLVVNIFSLLLSVSLALWTASHIFGFNLGPLLATSAAFSIILGLAMQDTLGHLFAGISMQIDRSFEIGDWVEVLQSTGKVTGQVKEISWRSTVLTGWNDELVTIPNRNMASAQISNFSATKHAIYRTIDLRIPFNAPLETAKAAALRCLQETPQICVSPAPVCLVRETTESWILLRCSFALLEYGSQFSVTDQVLSKILREFESQNIPLAIPMLEIKSPHKPTAV